MKKLLSILLVFVLMLSLVSCGDAKDKKAVEETVDSFLKAYVNSDFDALKKCIADEEDMPEELENMDPDKALEMALSEMPEEIADELEDSFKELMETLIEKKKDVMSYEIEEVEKKDSEEYVVTVKLVSPDSNAFEELMEEQLNDEKAQEIVTKLLQEGKLTQYSSETDVAKLVFEEAVKNCVAELNDAELESEEKTEAFTVVKTDDGEWLIDAEKLDLD